VIVLFDNVFADVVDETGEEEEVWRVLVVELWGVMDCEEEVGADETELEDDIEDEDDTLVEEEEEEEETEVVALWLLTA
jgi:hypothetical protein